MLIKDSLESTLRKISNYFRVLIAIFPSLCLPKIYLKSDKQSKQLLEDTKCKNTSPQARQDQLWGFGAPGMVVKRNPKKIVFLKISLNLQKDA